MTDGQTDQRKDKGDHIGSLWIESLAILDGLSSVQMFQNANFARFFYTYQNHDLQNAITRKRN